MTENDHILYSPLARNLVEQMYKAEYEVTCILIHEEDARLNTEKEIHNPETWNNEIMAHKGLIKYASQCPLCLVNNIKNICLALQDKIYKRIAYVSLKCKKNTKHTHSELKNFFKTHYFELPYNIIRKE